MLVRDEAILGLTWDLLVELDDNDGGLAHQLVHSGVRSARVSSIGNASLCLVVWTAGTVYQLVAD